MEQYNQPDFGKRLKLLRGRANQTVVAAAIGSTQGTLSKYEKGMLPDPIILLRIGRYFGVSIEWLLTGEERDMPHRNPIAAKIDKMLSDMPEEAQRDVLKYTETAKLAEERRAQIEEKKAG